MREDRDRPRISQDGEMSDKGRKSTKNSSRKGADTTHETGVNLSRSRSKHAITSFLDENAPVAMRLLWGYQLASTPPTPSVQKTFCQALLSTNAQIREFAGYALERSNGRHVHKELHQLLLSDAAPEASYILHALKGNQEIPEKELRGIVVRSLSSRSLGQIKVALEIAERFPDLVLEQKDLIIRAAYSHSRDIGLAALGLMLKTPALREEACTILHDQLSTAIPEVIGKPSARNAQAATGLLGLLRDTVELSTSLQAALISWRDPLYKGLLTVENELAIVRDRVAGARKPLDSLLSEPSKQDEQSETRAEEKRLKDAQEALQSVFEALNRSLREQLTTSPSFTRYLESLLTGDVHDGAPSQLQTLNLVASFARYKDLTPPEWQRLKELGAGPIQTYLYRLLADEPTLITENALPLINLLPDENRDSYKAQVLGRLENFPYPGVVTDLAAHGGPLTKQAILTVLMGERSPQDIRGAVWALAHIELCLADVELVIPRIFELKGRQVINSDDIRGFLTRLYRSSALNIFSAPSVRDLLTREIVYERPDSLDTSVMALKLASAGSTDRQVARLLGNYLFATPELAKAHDDLLKPLTRWAEKGSVGTQSNLLIRDVESFRLFSQNFISRYFKYVDDWVIPPPGGEYGDAGYNLGTFTYSYGLPSDGIAAEITRRLGKLRPSRGELWSELVTTGLTLPSESAVRVLHHLILNSAQPKPTLSKLLSIQDRRLIDLQWHLYSRARGSVGQPQSDMDANKCLKLAREITGKLVDFVVLGEDEELAELASVILGSTQAIPGPFEHPCPLSPDGVKRLLEKLGKNNPPFQTIQAIPPWVFYAPPEYISDYFGDIRSHIEDGYQQIVRVATSHDVSQPLKATAWNAILCGVSETLTVIAMELQEQEFDSTLRRRLPLAEMLDTIGTGSSSGCAPLLTSTILEEWPRKTRQLSEPEWLRHLYAPIMSAIQERAFRAGSELSPHLTDFYLQMAMRLRNA